MKLRENIAADFSEATIRHFLLGQLAADEQAAFEEALFTNPQLERRARLTEIEISDDYVFEKLTSKQRQLFTENFLLTSDRRKALQASTALRAQLAEAPGAQRSQRPAGSYALMLLRHPVWRFAFASIVLVLLMAGAWLVTKEPQLVRQIIHPRARPEAISTSTPEVAHHGTDSAAPIHQDQPPQTPEHEAGLQTLVLRQASDAPATLTVAGDTTSVRFALVVEHAVPSGYRAEVVTRDGEIIYTADQIFVADGAGQVSLDVPAGKLKTGDFQVKLTQISDGTQAGIYHFRVQ